MALPQRVPRRRKRGRNLQAAARILPDDNKRYETAEPLPTGGFGWQNRAWHVYRHLGAIHYAMSFIRDNVALIDYYVAAKSDDPEAEAEPLELDHPAAVELERLGNGPYGGVSDLFAELVVHNKVAGEGRLSVRYERDGEPIAAPTTDDPPGDAEEVWEVLTAQTLAKRKRDPKFKPAESVRIWKPDPEKPDHPDSSLRAVLTECEQLLLIQQMTTGTLQSRLHNGILAIAEELDPTPPAPPDEGDDEMGPLMRDIFTALSSPIAEPNAAAAIMPYLLMGKAEWLDKLKHITLDRDFDAQILEIKHDLLATVAGGIDLPAERLVGLSDASHWCVDDETEVLTMDGWQRESDLSVGDMVLTLNHETGVSEWQPVLDIYRADVVDEPMVALESQTHSSLTTPDHRWPVIQYRSGRKWTTTEKMSANQDMIAAAPHADLPREAKYSDALVELVAWAWTDSSLRGGGGFKALNQSHSRNPERVDRIRAALAAEFGPPVDSLGWRDYPEWRERRQADGEQHGFGGPQTMFYLNRVASDVLAEHITGRKVHRDFIRSLTRAQLELFIDVSCQGDGRHYRRGSQNIWQKEYDDLEAFELACILSGRAVKLRHDPDPDGWEVYPRTSATIRPAKAAYEAKRTGTDSASQETVSYTGRIWCPSTENQTWFARRDGKSYFTGNTTWFIGETEYAQHIKPAVDIVVGGVLHGWLRPAWEAAGLNPDDFEVFIDTTPLTSKVMKSADAIQAYKLGEMSGEALRRHLGFDASDAPTDEDPGLRGQVRSTDVDVPAGQDTVEPGPPGASVQAAATIEDLGARLADIDADVLADLETIVGQAVNQEAEAAEERLLEAMAAAGISVDTEPLAEALAEANISPAEIVPDATFENLTEPAGEVMRSGLDRAARTVAEATGSSGFSFDDAAVAAAAGGLAGGLVEWLRSRWFSDAPGPDDNAARFARHGADLRPPGGLLLDSMTEAGGGLGNSPGARGTANGATVEAWLLESGLAIQGYRWRHGGPAEPFPPHRRLDGVEFTGRDDPKIANTSNRWPHNEAWLPGDHRFCTCTWQKILLPATEAGML